MCLCDGLRACFLFSLIYLPPTLSQNPQLYPLIGITAVTCLLGAWYGPYYLYKSPENQ